MKLKEMFKINFKSKKDDRGDYSFCVSAKNSDKALTKILDKIYKNKEYFVDLIKDYYMTYDDIFDLSRAMNDAEEKEQRKYYYEHLPTTEFIGFSI